jgi:hypothetical protein
MLERIECVTVRFFFKGNKPICGNLFLAEYFIDDIFIHHVKSGLFAYLVS